MVAVAGARGYGSASVARVSLAAGVSSETFYEQFADREDCFLAAYRSLAAGLREGSSPFGARSAGSAREWRVQAREAIQGTLTALDRDRGGARVLLFESLAGGSGGALGHERGLTERALERCARSLLERTPAGGPLIDLPAAALIGATRSVIGRALIDQEPLYPAPLASELVDWARAYARRERVRWSTGPSARLAKRPSGLPPRVAGLATLPRGRHRLPPAAVSQSQRLRIINATARVIQSKGYAASSVKDIVADARISRAVFYEHFSGKQHALLEAQQSATHSTLNACQAAFQSTDPWPTRIWKTLGVLLEQTAANPALSHICLLDCYAAGAEAIRHAENTPRTYSTLLQKGYTQPPARTRLPPITTDAVAGAIHHIIRQTIAANDTPSLPQRLPQIAYIALAPSLGTTRATNTIQHLATTTQP